MSNSSEKVYVLCRGKVDQWSKWMEMEEGCIFEVMPSHEGAGSRNRRRKGRRQNLVVTLDEAESSNKEERETDGGQGKETENSQLEHIAEGGEESGWNEDSGEKRSEKVDVRQLKENMGDCMNILVENLVSLPKEDREKILSQYMSNVDEKDKKMAEITERRAVIKLA